MVVELLEDKKRWDQFVETSPQGLLFHKWDFLKTVERHSKYRFLPYCVYSGDQPVCIFPFFIGRDHGLTIMNSPPPGAQIPYLGPAFDPGVLARRASSKEKILDQVTDELCDEIDTIAPNYVSVTTVPNFIDVRSFMWKNYREHLRFTYTIDLEKPLDEIWASFTRRCRQKIKRVSAHSPEIQQTNDVSRTLDIWRARFSERGTKVPLLSDSYLKDLVAAFPQDITVYSLIIDGRLATAEACCVMQKERYAIWIGGTSARRDLGVNEYLDWEVVKQAKSEGFKKLDLGVWDVGFSPYKAKFDPILEPFCTFKKTDTLYKIYYVCKKIRGRASET
jgi:Acetyltransferase (GNAT) domain